MEAGLPSLCQVPVSRHEPWTSLSLSQPSRWPPEWKADIWECKDMFITLGQIVLFCWDYDKNIYFGVSSWTVSGMFCNRTWHKNKHTQSLPNIVCHCTSVSYFKSSLKAFLFSRTISLVPLPRYITVCVCVCIICSCMCCVYVLYALNL